MGWGLFAQLIAIGVWATRPHLSCFAAKVGDSSTFILFCCKGGRLAHIYPVLLQRWASRPSSFNHFPVNNSEPQESPAAQQVRQGFRIIKGGAYFVRLVSQIVLLGRLLGQRDPFIPGELERGT